MIFKVLYTKEALSDLGKLGSATAERITRKIDFFIHQMDPFSYAKPLKGLLRERYRFRVGDYRIIFRVEKNGSITILLILRIQHRREIYRV